MIVASYCKREAALNSWILGLVIWILQRAACQESLLGLVKSYGSEFLPVVD